MRTATGPISNLGHLFKCNYFIKLNDKFVLADEPILGEKKSGAQQEAVVHVKCCQLLDESLDVGRTAAQFELLRSGRANFPHNDPD